MKRNYLKPLSDYGKNRANGQVLVTLLMFVVIALTVISMTIATVISNSQTATSAEKGVDVYYVAEAGAENAIMMLLRNPNLRGEIYLPVGESMSISTVSGLLTEPPTITVTGKTPGNYFIKILKIETSYNNNILTVTSWKEIQEEIP